MRPKGTSHGRGAKNIKWFNKRQDEKNENKKDT